MAGQKVLRNSLFLFGFPAVLFQCTLGEPGWDELQGSSLVIHMIVIHIVCSSFSYCDLSEILSSHWEQGVDDQEWPGGEK